MNETPCYLRTTTQRTYISAAGTTGTDKNKNKNFPLSSTGVIGVLPE